MLEIFHTSSFIFSPFAIGEFLLHPIRNQEFLIFFTPVSFELILHTTRLPSLVPNPTLFSLYTLKKYLLHYVEEKVVVIHRGRCNNNVFYCLYHDVVT